MNEYGQDFIENVNPLYARDIVENEAWYSENVNDLLLNVFYPSKLEQDYLKHIEQEQQKRNDIRYK